ncbi:MAG: kelch motif-containing protein, partial [Thermoplasmata archaeon]|nr:kelch motif-containing protein [Thermoplasmata archaeon]
MPPAGSDAGLVWDLALGYYVFFGGCLATQCDSNQTWLYYAGTWVNATGTLPSAPSPRADAAMGWDPNLQAIVLFGGCSTNACPLGDTWKFNGTWTNITGSACSSACPNPSFGASIGWDPTDKVTILFGGCTGNSNLGCSATGNQTAALGATRQWSILPYTHAPGPRFFAASYGLYVFGGSYPCGLSTCDFSDFWQFQSVASGWFNVSRISSGNPGGRAQAAIGLDWSTGYLV